VACPLSRYAANANHAAYRSASNAFAARKTKGTDQTNDATVLGLGQRASQRQADAVPFARAAAARERGFGIAVQPLTAVGHVDRRPARGNAVRLRSLGGLVSLKSLERPLPKWRRGSNHAPGPALDAEISGRLRPDLGMTHVRKIAVLQGEGNVVPA
jgi:hypothetical protein